MPHSTWRCPARPVRSAGWPRRGGAPPPPPPPAPPPPPPPPPPPSLGRFAERVHLEFEPAGPNQVALHVTAPELRLLPPVAAAVFDLGGFDRRIVLDSEDAR
jgi:hypothetical protein